MAALSNLQLNTRVLISGGIVIFIILLLAVGHPTRTVPQAAAWVKGTPKSDERRSPLQDKLSDIYNSTLGVSEL